MNSLAANGPVSSVSCSNAGSSKVMPSAAAL